jgi:proline iminopeptidase
MWDYLEPVARLLLGYRVHRFDQRGCGRSKGPADYSVGRAVADIEALRRHWGHDSWKLVGHSWGATLALAYAWTHPDRIDSLVLCCGLGPGTEWKTDYRAEEARRLTRQQFRRREDLKHADRTPAEEIEYNTLCWCTNYADVEEGLAWARQDALNAPYPVNTAANQILQREAVSWSAEHVTAWCQQITAPVLVMHGECDPRPLWNVRRIVDALPHGQLTVLPGVGHEPWREDPTGFASVLNRFLSTR